MTSSDRWGRIRELVEQALDRPEAERAPWLAEACGEDVLLQHEVEAVLEAGLGDDAFLEPSRDLLEIGPALDAGARIGGYRIVRRIGVGGMGTVYEAEQESPRRRVALKTMNVGLLSAASQERFRFEVEVLASLRHPGIAQVYETGTHVAEAGGLRQEIPWFAMEYVEGAKPILEYAQEKQLGRRARLRVLLQICDAVAHGHRKRVIHRDLKPDNLLVDPSGRVKVIDFGVARVADEDRIRATLRTNAGEIVGTLPYMSPEQLAGGDAEIDTRTDVYSLGVVAYELLAGCLPIDVRGQTVGRAARRIEELSPVRPSRHDPELKGNVEAILLKALAKRPEDRYGSVEAFGDDIRRHLDDLPVRAHPPSAGYRLRMFVRRHSTLVGAGLAVFLAVASAAVVSYQHARRSERAERFAAQEAAEARAQHARAQLVLEQLLERSTRSTMEHAPIVQQLSGGPEVARSMMQHTLEDLRLVERLSGDDPRARIALASAWIRFGDAAGSPNEANLGDLEGANQSFAHALGLVVPLLEFDPQNVPARWAAMRALQKRGEVLLAQQKREEGLALLQQALALAESLHRDVPDNLDFEAAVAGVHDRLGAAYGQAGDVETAEEHLALSRAGFARLAEKAPEVPMFRHYQALGFQQQAATAWSREEYEAARDGFAEAAWLLEPLAQRYAADRRHLERLAWNVMWAGSAEQQLGHLDVAEKRFTSALGLYRSLAEADPRNRKIPPMIGNLLWSLGTLAQDRANAATPGTEARRGYLDAALGWFEEAVSHFEQQLADGDANPRTSGMLQAVRQRVDEVQALLERELDDDR